MRLISTSYVNNNTNNSEIGGILEAIDITDPLSSYFLALSAAILGLFTILANICTILLLVRYRPMQKSISNLYILSLSCADMLIGVLILVLVAAHIFQSSVFSFLPWICDAWQIVDFILSTVSLYSICAIALDRVWNLEKPLRVFKRSRRLARKLILCIWLLPFLIWLPYYYYVTGSRIDSSATVFGLRTCTSEYSNRLIVPMVALPVLYVPAIALVAMFVRISIVVHGHLSFLREHSNNPQGTPGNNNSVKTSKESTPFTRTPEQTKKLSEASLTSGYTSMKSPRSQSPRYLQRELAPLSEERSSGRERSLSEQYTTKIRQFEVDSSNHLRVKSSTSNPTRRESIKAKQMILSQRGEHFAATTGTRAAEKRLSFSRSSLRNLSLLSRNGSRRFSVIAIPSNLAELLQREGVSQQVRAAKAVALILFCFLLCWLPFLVLWPLKFYCRSCVSDSFYSVSIWLNYLCSAFNPLLYTLSSPRVRVVLTSYCSFMCSDNKRRWKQSYYGKSGTLV